MSSLSPTDTILLALDSKELQRDISYLDQATLATKTRLLLALVDYQQASQPPTISTIDALAKCLDSSSRLKPMLDIVPLFPFLGWPHDVPCPSLDVLPDAMHAPLHLKNSADILLSKYNDRIKHCNERASPSHQPILLHLQTLSDAMQTTNTTDIGPPSPGVAIHNALQSPLSTSQARVIGMNDAPGSAADTKDSYLQFKNVAVGGTFDRLHAGHRLLLAATALVSTERIFIGITSDKLLANKRNKELLETYDKREAAAVAYMHRVHPRVAITSGPLIDPKIPPICATEENFDAIVVSEETVVGAEEINHVRASLGFHPLVIVVVGLLSGSGGGDGGKLSSTDLRALESKEKKDDGRCKPICNLIY